MTQPSRRRLSRQHVARQQLFDGDEGQLRRYARLVIGDYSVWKLLRYELINTLALPLPGALGLAARKLVCPSLFRRTGRNAIFGRNVILRNANRISLGDGVVIDDGVLLDARGAESGEFEIGDRTILHRGAVVLSKGGELRIGRDTDVGAGAWIVSQGGCTIGDSVKIAGGCLIGGGLVGDDPQSPDAGPGDGRYRYSHGPVRIGDGCTIYPGAMILDGVEIGPEAIIGAGAIVREDVAPHTTLAPVARFLTIPHGARGDGMMPPPDTVAGLGIDSAPPRYDDSADDEVRRALLEAVEDVNQTRSADDQVDPADEPGIFTLFDSLDTVNFLVGAERRLESIGLTIDLVATWNLDPTRFNTFEDLIDFLRTECAPRA